MASHGGRAGFIALIAAIVLGCGGTLPSVSPTSVATTQPSSGPTPTPGASQTSPQPSTSPSVAPTGTPIVQEGWQQLAAASDATAEWSPDAAHVLVGLVEPGGPPESQQVQLLTRDGGLVRAYEQQAQPVWLDEASFVTYRLDWQQDESGEWFAATGPNGERSGTAMLGSVASDVLEEVALPLGPALSSGTGALAIIRFDAAELPEAAVWSDGVLTDWQPGAPLAWSAGGDRLVLIHPAEAGPESGGWLEVLEWPGLATAWQSGPEVSVATAVFDPTGAHLAWPGFEERPTSPRQVPEFDLWVNVADLATGDLSSAQAPENGEFEWLSGDRLISVGFESLQASVIDRDGTVLAQEMVVGPNVIVSADGLTALFYDAELDEPAIQILRGDQLTLLDSPGLLTGPSPQLARDGSGVLVVVRAPTDAPTGSPATVLIHYL